MTFLWRIVLLKSRDLSGVAKTFGNRLLVFSFSPLIIYFLLFIDIAFTLTFSKQSVLTYKLRWCSAKAFVSVKTNDYD